MKSAINIIDVITRWIFIFCIPVFLLTGFIAVAVNSQWLYQHSFNTYGVGETTGIETIELEKAAAEIISYFNSPEELLSVTVIKDGNDFVLFNEKEVSHMKDVKALIRLDYFVLLGLAIYIIGYILVNLYIRKSRGYNQLASSAFYGSGITLGLILLLGIVSVTNFNAFFTAFHHISFANDFWLLDPNTDYLIMLFPGGFWYDCVMYITVAVGITAVIIGVLMWLYLKKLNTRN